MNTLKSTGQNRQLHFLTSSYPTFGKHRKPFDELNPPKTVTNSPYYWWFMFLRLNNDYKETCELNGKGKCSELYKDFGNIFEVNFKEWWRVKAHLFSEPIKGYKMMIAKSSADIAPFNDDEVINLIVPLTWSQRSLKKYFSKLILKNIKKGKRGVSVEESQAKYRISGRWSIEALENAYKIYVEKQNSLSEERKVPLADLAIRANLPYARREKAKEGIKNRHTVDIRATLTILANRHYKRAQIFISSSSTTSFPYN